MKTPILLLIFVIGSLSVQGCSVLRKSTVESEAHEEEQISFKAREYFLKGLYLQMEERYSEALIQFHKAQIYDTTSATICNSLAENYIKLNELEPAYYHLSKARSLDPENIETLTLLGEVYFRQRKDSLAIGTYEKILALDPLNEEARNFLFFLYEKNDDVAGKARLYEDLLHIYGKSQTVLKQIVEAYVEQDDFRNALKYINEWLEIDSTNSTIWELRAEAQDNLGETAPAIKSFRKALELEPGNSEAMNSLALLFREQRMYQEVINLYQPVLNKGDNLTARIMMAEAHYFLDQPEQTRELLLPLASRKDVPWGVYDLLGRIELESKNYQKAAGYFQEIVNSDPKNRYGWLFLGFTYSDMGDKEAVSANFRDAVSHLPRDAELWSWYGISLQQQKKFREAVGPFNRALVLDPSNLNALSSLPIVYEELNMVAKSDSIYEFGLQQLPDNPLLLNNYAWSLVERDLRLEEALEMSHKALTAEPENGAYLDTYGWILYKMGDYDGALEWIQKSLEVRPESAVVWEHLGDIFFKLDNVEQARASWQKAFELDPGNKSVNDKLEAHSY